MSEEFTTIGDFFKLVLDNKKCVTFYVVKDGQSFAANEKTHRPARISIMLPPEICGKSLKDLDKWCLYGVAIPKEIVEQLKEEKKP